MVWSWVHLIGAVVSLIAGLLIFRLRKGDRRHRVLGWIYVLGLGSSLVGIVIRTAPHPRPFAAYAVFCLLLITASIAASRFRDRVDAWRSWHASLMSLTYVGSAMAALSIAGGVLVGASSGPAFYRMFNVLIVAVTGVGLWLINTRRAVWPNPSVDPVRTARFRFSALAISAAGLLVLTQVPLAMEN